VKLDPAALKSALKAEAAEALAARSSGVPASELVAARAGRMASLVCAAYTQWSAAHRIDGGGVSLVAVGSFGRGELLPASDIDVRLLARTDADLRAISRVAESLFVPLWDAGISLGHQTTSVKDTLALAATDLTTATGLLDLRTLAGDASVTDELVARARDGIFAEGNLHRFLDRLDEELEARHERFGSSVYLLEPDVKHGAGGARDLDHARWAASARWGGTASRETGPLGQGLSRDDKSSISQSFYRELVARGVLLPREALELANAEESLRAIRWELHASAGRRSERLTFEAQESVAMALGFGGRGEGGEQIAVAAEAFMQRYYTTARSVLRARESLVFRAHPPRRRGRLSGTPLEHGLLLFDRHVTLGPGQRLEEQPLLALRLYEASVRHGAPVHPHARENVARFVQEPEFTRRLRDDGAAGPLFLQLITTMGDVPTKRGSLVAELHEVGLLLAMVPEFLPVTGRVHHDIYHVYTVDQHSVAAVDRLRAIFRGDYAQEFPLASRLAAEGGVDIPLIVATLLHDVGKGYPDENGSRKFHAKTGAAVCRQVVPRFGLPPEDVERVASLVNEHLAMYHTATRRDLEDAATIRDFSAPLDGPVALKQLYLLTVVDVATTSPNALTAWKARMLDELYLATERWFSRGEASSGEAEKEFARERLRTAERVARVAQGFPGNRAFFDAFAGSMPERYLSSRDLAGMQADAILAEGRSRGEIRAAIVPLSQSFARAATTEALPDGSNPEVAALCVVADDVAGLLAHITGVLARFRVEIHAAEIHSRKTPDGDEAIDLFVIRGRDPGALVPKISAALQQSPATDAPARGREERSRRGPRFRGDVVVDPRGSADATIIEVFAQDRVGLLHALAYALYELALDVVFSKVNTEGDRVADVFYVRERDGSKVHGTSRVQQIRDRLLHEVLGASSQPG
jgi:[protein-PII] uridylyltransferase